MSNKIIKVGTDIYFEGETIKKTTKKKIVELICMDYLKYSCKLNLENKYNFLSEREELYSNNSKSEIKKMKGFISYFNFILDNLSFDSRIIITNDYLKQESERQANWWMEYYSRSTYFRNKNKAINEFLQYAS